MQWSKFFGVHLDQVVALGIVQLPRDAMVLAHLMLEIRL